jgi:hypothetical protein
MQGPKRRQEQELVFMSLHNEGSFLSFASEPGDGRAIVYAQPEILSTFFGRIQGVKIGRCYGAPRRAVWMPYLRL